MKLMENYGPEWDLNLDEVGSLVSATLHAAGKLDHKCPGDSLVSSSHLEVGAPDACEVQMISVRCPPPPEVRYAL